jgi:hypothetical protein
MWHTQSLPLFDIGSLNRRMLWSGDEQKDQLLCHPNRANMEALGGFLVSEIKLHAVSEVLNSGYIGVAMLLKSNADKTEKASAAAKRPVVVFDAIETFEDFNNRG